MTQNNITQDTPVRSPFCIHCEKNPLSQFFFTSAATDASDKYEVSHHAFSRVLPFTLDEKEHILINGKVAYLHVTN